MAFRSKVVEDKTRQVRSALGEALLEDNDILPTHLAADRDQVQRLFYSFHSAVAHDRYQETVQRRKQRLKQVKHITFFYEIKIFTGSTIFCKKITFLIKFHQHNIKIIENTNNFLILKS